MKKFNFAMISAAFILAGALAFAASANDKSPIVQPTPKSILQQHGFIDEDGDGINDLARDSDNDGIPNCIDPDWERPQDGSGYMNRFGYKRHNANQQGGGLYNYGYHHQWSNNWANNNPNFCNQENQGGGVNRNRRSKRGR